MASFGANKPRLTFLQRSYLPAIFKGLWLTMKFFFRKKSSITYPDVPVDLPAGYRGVPRLNTSRVTGDEVCVSCKLCEVVCPPKAIYIESTEYPDPKTRERRPEVFQIDFGRCINCGFCEEACPVEAIEMSQSVEIVGYSREELVYQKDQLLAIPKDERKARLRSDYVV